MIKPRTFLLLMTILPWLTLPILGKSCIKRYLPATIFISLISKIIHIIANRMDWWRFHTKINSVISGSTAYIIGPEFLAALWTLKFTYGKLLLYLISNTIGHILFAFPGMRFFKRIGVVSFKVLEPYQLVLLFLVRALLLYGFQFAYEHLFKKQSSAICNSLYQTTSDSSDIKLN
ncbi:hypothetical protein [Bacillus marasmi]|uniref:hypothetical protein n=1 Tax=Bacillus marasmi TaxID=1926279 RepID=UPI00164D9420|nr:hypothetical protein [Bacillus marasmi]